LDKSKSTGTILKSTQDRCSSPPINDKSLNKSSANSNKQKKDQAQQPKKHKTSANKKKHRQKPNVAVESSDSLMIPSLMIRRGMLK